MELKPSNHLTNLIGQIDYFAGYWNGSVKGIDEKRTVAAIASGATAIAKLDDSLLTEANSLERIVQAHFVEAVHTEKALVEIWATLIGSEAAKGATRKQYLRSEAAKFVVPAFAENSKREAIFASVSPFLIGQRLPELFDWYKQNRESGSTHPLLLIGTVHLCLLHIYPFSKASHAASLLALWRNVISAGYDFCRYQHLASTFANDSENYFSALRQAEKTVYGSWSSLNVWLEYFLSNMVLIQRKLEKERTKSISMGRLTETQRQILNAVNKKGALTRDAVAAQTGINENTVKYNLIVLTKRGYLTRLGKGRTTSYAVGKS